MTARVSLIHNFSQIAREHFRRLSSTETALRNATTTQQRQSLESKIQTEAIIVILFSTLTIEAYIYDYASRHFSDSFVRSYLDKLDIVSKWVIIPRLATGKELPRDSEWFSLLKGLVQKRNHLIHHKSSSPPRELETAREYTRNLIEEDKERIQAAKSSIYLLDILIEEISKIDPDERVWIETYLKE